jgi:spermidine synthase
MDLDTSSASPVATSARAHRDPIRVVWLAQLFFASGFSGLVYQTVWLRMLIRALGVTVYAVTIIVAVFMIGLAIGSLLGGRFARARVTSALRLYALVELLIGVVGAFTTALMLVLPQAFRALVTTPGSGPGVTAARMALSAVVLLPTTVLMGATLPLLTGVVARSGSVGRRAGLLYGANTLGAVLGVLSTGFFLIALVGEIRSVLIAASVNVAVGILAFGLSRPVVDAHPGEPESVVATDPRAARIARTVLAVSAASGFCALALEVIWTRLLSLLLGNSVYGFSAMLASYLLGIGAGSLLVIRWLDAIRRPLLAFALMELAAAILAIISLVSFVELGLSYHDARYTYSLLWGLGDFGRLFAFSALVVLPVTLVYGAIFPLASRLAAPPGSRVEGAIGRLYAFNTVGGIFGSLFAGLVLIPAVGTFRGFLVVAFAMFAIGLYLLRLAAQCEGPYRIRQIGLVSSLVFVVAATSVSFEDPFLAVLLARLGDPMITPLSHREDRGATVTAIALDGLVSLFINGLYVSSTSQAVPEVMIHFPLTFNPEPGPKRILAVGLGVGADLRYGVDLGHHITIVELNNAVVDTFRSLNKDAATYLDSGTSGVVVEDGRNFILRSEEKFDLILVDGSPPLYASGMANLYSSEFMRLVKDHLSPNGMFGVWFPVVCFESDFWHVFRSFSDVFPWVTLYSVPRTNNAFILASRADTDPFAIDYPLFAKRWTRSSTPARSFDPRPIWDASRYDRAALRARALAFSPSTDDRPYTEFPLQSFLRGEPYLTDNGFLASAFMAEDGRR